MSRGPLHGLWWASPIGSVLLVLPLSLWLAWSTSDLSFRLLHRTPKVLTDEYALLFATAGAVLLLGVVAATAARPRHWPERWPGLSTRQLEVVSRSASVCFWLTILGYVAFGVAGAARGVRLSHLVDALTNQANFEGYLEQGLAPVTGVTTLTQVGVAYVVLAGLAWAGGRPHRVVRRTTIVLVLALARSFFLTERLALIEVVIPLVLVLAVARHRLGDIRTTIAPVLALPALVLLFGIFEYSRSWNFFRWRTTASYPEFVIDRLAGYYATAYNNGAAQLVDGGFPRRLPYVSIEAFWTAPGIAQLNLYERLTGRSYGEAYAEVLQQRVNPEFNNPCGICSPIIDFGSAWGLVFLFVAGLLAGLCWAAFRDGSPAGLLFYPLVFTGLLELPRYLYWTQGRLVPAAVALGVVAWLLHRSAERPLLVPAPLPARVP